MIERIAVIMPSWIGDVVMATPALRLLHEQTKAHIAAITRPGLGSLLAGLATIDAIHIADSAGPLGPFRLQNAVNAARPAAALLLPNSFASALGVFLAGTPIRVGYARDARSPLLTRRLQAPKDRSGRWSPVPAVRYYRHAARAMVDPATPPLEALQSDSITHAPLGEAANAFLELAITDQEDAQADQVLATARVAPPFAILNPGGNNPAKRWPPDRFAAVADHLATRHRLRVLLTGSPAEADLLRSIASLATTAPATCLDSGLTLGSLKAVIARARIMLTNDTGPRHIAAALNTPLVTLFGPTDPRWTTIPVRPLASGRPAETILVANKSLDPARTSNHDPHASRIDRITTDEVLAALEHIL